MSLIIFSFFVSFVALLIGCGGSTSNKSNQDELEKAVAIDTDASEILNSTRIATEKRTSGIIIGSGWPGDGMGPRALCFTGDQVKTSGLSKIIHQIESKFYYNEKVWIYRLASYRIQSVVELKNIRPFPLTFQRLGREKFEKECGRKLITKVLSGQRLFYEAHISQVQNIFPQDYSFLGTSHSFDTESFIGTYEAVYPQFNYGYFSTQSSASGGITNPYPSIELKDVARAFVHNVQEYAKTHNLGEQVLEIYGVGTAPAY